MVAKLKVAELKLRDVVALRVDGAPFNSSVVTQITEDVVKLFRPYATTSDFSYTGGVIPYVGIEQWEIWKDSQTEFELLERMPEPR